MSIQRVNQFDVEQGIMNCWQIIDDLNMVIEMWDTTSEEDRVSIINGIIKLYQAKFDNLFSNKFERFLKENVITERKPKRERDLINDCNGDDIYLDDDKEIYAW